jgi:hypothetical protein
MLSDCAFKTSALCLKKPPTRLPSSALAGAAGFTTRSDRNTRDDQNPKGRRHTEMTGTKVEAWYADIRWSRHSTPLAWGVPIPERRFGRKPSFGAFAELMGPDPSPPGAARIGNCSGRRPQPTFVSFPGGCLALHRRRNQAHKCSARFPYRRGEPRICKSRKLCS